jgi:hypothetical protein
MDLFVYSIECESMVLFFFCRFFFALRGEKEPTKGNKSGAQHASARGSSAIERLSVLCSSVSR